MASGTGTVSSDRSYRPNQLVWETHTVCLPTGDLSSRTYRHQPGRFGRLIVSFIRWLAATTSTKEFEG